MDTRVLLTSNGPVGEFVKVRITGTQVYDLRGEICGPGDSGDSGATDGQRVWRLEKKVTWGRTVREVAGVQELQELQNEAIDVPIGNDF